MSAELSFDQDESNQTRITSKGSVSGLTEAMMHIARNPSNPWMSKHAEKRKKLDAIKVEENLQKEADRRSRLIAEGKNPDESWGASSKWPRRGAR